MRDDQGLRHLERGKCLLEEGRIGEAIVELKKALEYHPNYPDIHHHLGVALSMTGAYNEAVNELREAVELNPNYVEARLNLALLLTEMGRMEEAAEEYEIVNRLEGVKDKYSFGVRARLANAHKKLGDTYFAIGDIDEAIEEYTKALKIAPAFIDIRMKLGKALLEKEDFGGAIEQLERVAKENPRYAEALVQLGLAYYKAGDVAKAEK